MESAQQILGPCSCPTGGRLNFVNLALQCLLEPFVKLPLRNTCCDAMLTTQVKESNPLHASREVLGEVRVGGWHWVGCWARQVAQRLLLQLKQFCTMAPADAVTKLAVPSATTSLCCQQCTGRSVTMSCITRPRSVSDTSNAMKQDKTLCQLLAESHTAVFALSAKQLY